jgi:hypothetical protein
MGSGLNGRCKGSVMEIRFRLIPLVKCSVPDPIIALGSHVSKVRPLGAAAEGGAPPMTVCTEKGGRGFPRQVGRRKPFGPKGIQESA